MQKTTSHLFFDRNRDVFIHADMSLNGLFIPQYLPVNYMLSRKEYWDKRKYETICKTHERVIGKEKTYWISGNVLDTWIGGSRQERAKNFAIWYHENNHKLQTFVLD